jgi:hypothetical protein
MALGFYKLCSSLKNVHFLKADGSESSLDLDYLESWHPNCCFISEFEMQRGLVKVWFCSAFTVDALKNPKQRDEYAIWVNPNFLTEFDL